MKNIFKKIAVWYLTKYFEPTIERIEINENGVILTVKGFTKDDNDYHHYSINLEYYLKTGKKTKSFKDKSTSKVFVDGKKIKLKI